MSWTLLSAVVAIHGLVLLLLRQRRAEIARMSAGVAERDRARREGTHRARLQYPHVDLSRCIGCGACVRACPEEGVLDIVHGQAVVVHGARCVGHGRCAEECPTGALAVTLGDVSQRNDIPALSEELEADGVPGLFLAGELTGYALIRTAISHGSAVADAVARRARGDRAEEALDLCIVGAGPAGIACALRAKELGLSALVLEREELGGTVAKYPRRKLVMTQPVELPLHGRLGRTSYAKEELLELWTGIVERHRLPLSTGEELLGLERDGGGDFLVRTSRRTLRAGAVCLALGRRGKPRKLGVPGEELTKVTYSLVDARSYTGRRILVVGGGDSAVEAAVGLAEQEGNDVTLSYRQGAFTRVKAGNLARLGAASEAGDLRVLLDSDVRAIDAYGVDLELRGEGRIVRLANDDVFVMAGGEPPFPLLERCGVSFDPERLRRTQPPADRGAGLLQALTVTFFLALATAAWAAVFADYYGAEPAARLDSRIHWAMRPSGPLGLAFGVAATLSVSLNLLYLVRRSRVGRWLPGTLRGWMTGHIVTGLAALLLAYLHAGLHPGRTVGGHAFAALAVLVATGAIGRYFYAFVPRAANGSEYALGEVRARLAALSTEWDELGRGIGDRLRREVVEGALEQQWKGSLLHRAVALLCGEHTLRRRLARVAAEARAEGLPDGQIRALLDLARRAHRTALMAAHFEDLRGLLSAWRYFHRWVALLMVLLVALHILIAVRFGGVFG